ncbi:S-layer homology domain-containing protein [Helicovermis profundi]|uniref:SLH domain-containing protein n=1 Tax=Helicovermis profundi TaxID=3065157 RepID=A0AAU9E9V5_9FIRM|nr:hypothetical protein HLPR_26140 [Clostridia bacterium S502]
MIVKNNENKSEVKKVVRKLVISFILATILSTFLYSLNTYAETLTFTDVSDTWAEPYIETLIGKGVINGYLDGTFKPNGTITVAEFTKLLLKATDREIGNVNIGKSWYTPVVKKAMEDNIILENEFVNYTKEITRSEMARMVVRSENLIEDELGSYIDEDLDAFSYYIPDFNTVKANMKDSVLKVYSRGIITGYPDRSFKASNSATRAEASVIVNRLIDKTIRKPLKLTDEKVVDTFKDIPKALLKTDKEVVEKAITEDRTYYTGDYIIVGDELRFNDPYNNEFSNYEASDEFVPNINKRAKDILKVFLDHGKVASAYYSENNKIVKIQTYLSTNAMESNHNGYTRVWLEENNIDVAKDYQHSAFSHNASMSMTLMNLKAVYDNDEEYVSMVRDTMISLFGKDTGDKITDYIVDTTQKSFYLKDNEGSRAWNFYSTTINNIKVDYVGRYGTVYFTELHK